MALAGCGRSRVSLLFSSMLLHLLYTNMNLVNTTPDDLHVLPRDQEDELLSGRPQAGRQEVLRSLHVTTTIRADNSSLVL